MRSLNRLAVRVSGWVDDAVMWRMNASYILYTVYLYIYVYRFVYETSAVGNVIRGELAIDRRNESWPLRWLAYSAKWIVDIPVQATIPVTRCCQLSFPPGSLLMIPLSICRPFTTEVRAEAGRIVRDILRIAVRPPEIQPKFSVTTI